MTPRNLKRKAEVEASLEARVTQLEGELATARHDSDLANAKLCLTERLLATEAKNNAEWKHVFQHQPPNFDELFPPFDNASEVASLRLANQGLKQEVSDCKDSLLRAQQHYKECHKKLKQCQCEVYCARAEKADQKVEALSAELIEIRDLTDEMRGFSRRYAAA